MHDWPTIELVLGTLLVTSFTCVGLLALWAATSPRHWFVRAAVVMAVLSPLLLIPAYEPLVAFTLQCIVVTGGATLYRWQHRRQLRPAPSPDFVQLAPSTQFRFSLSTLLLVTVFVAVATPLAVQLPQLNFDAWSSVALIGAVCGLITLLAAWMCYSRYKYIVWPVGLLFAASLGALLCWLDWFVYSIVKFNGWPPTVTVQSWNAMLGNPEPPLLVWLCVLPIIAVVTTMMLLLYVTCTMGIAGRGAIPNRRWSISASIARALFAILLMLTAAFPLSILYTLMHPLPVPPPSMPKPNGYDDLVAAGQMLSTGSPILNTMVEPASTAELAAEVTKFAAVFERLRLGLSRECMAPVWPIDPKSPITMMTFADVQAIRAAGRAMSLEARLAQEQERFHDVARISVENMRVGQATTRGGVVIHFLVGIAIQGIAQSTLYPAIPHLDANACRETIVALEQLDRNHDPLDEVIHRDRIYGENAFGWHGHLVEWLRRRVHSDSVWATEEALRRNHAIARLLMTELALRQYQLVNGKLPPRLDQLAPDYLSAVPVDPYDAAGAAIRYRLAPDGYLLYSVGRDGRDDGGTPPPNDNRHWWDNSMKADLLLAAWFAPEEESVATEIDDAAAWDPTDAPDGAEP